MPAPYDYTIGDIASPQQSFLQGIQMVDFMRKREQDQAAAVEAKRKEAELQALYAEALQPGATPDVFERLNFAIDPKQAALSRMQQLNDAQQDAMIGNMGSVLAPLLGGKPELAIQNADELIKAMENSPNSDPKSLQALKASRQVFSQSPQLAQVSLTTSMMGLGEKGRKAVNDIFEAMKKPEEQRKAAAEASKAEREAKGEPSDQFEILTPKQSSSFGLPSGTYQRDKTTGKITSIGSGGVTVNMPPQVQVGTIPQGYKLTYDTQGRPLSMEPIPGSQAARDVAAEADKAASSAASTVTSSNIVLSAADGLQDLIKKESFFKPVTGVGGAIVREKGGVLASGSAAVTAQKTIDTIKANIGFDRLTQMRKESPTGGALGNVTEKELAFLQSVLGSLDLNQDRKILSQNINKIKEIYTEILRKASAYPNAEKYGFDVPATSKSKPPASDAQPANRNIRVDY
jgi:hypothetical protein